MCELFNVYYFEIFRLSKYFSVNYGRQCFPILMEAKRWPWRYSTARGTPQRRYLGDTCHVVSVLMLRRICSIAVRAPMAERSTVQVQQGAASSRIGGTTLFQWEGQGEGP